jgi:hypothetical protein
MSEALRERITDEVEAALEASSLAWGRRGDEWVIAASEGLPRELRVRAPLTLPSPHSGGEGRVRGSDGVLVEAVLVEWDEITDESHEALALFLAVARAGLRGCRGELDDTSARLVAVLDGESLEAELPRGLHGVAAGCRRMAREARALLIPSLARAYLAFQRRGTD